MIQFLVNGATWRSCFEFLYLSISKESYTTSYMTLPTAVMRFTEISGFNFHSFSSPTSLRFVQKRKRRDSNHLPPEPTHQIHDALTHRATVTCEREISLNTLVVFKIDRMAVCYSQWVMQSPTVNQFFKFLNAVFMWKMLSLVDNSKNPKYKYKLLIQGNLYLVKCPILRLIGPC